MTTDQRQPEPSAPVLPEISNWRCLCVLAVFTLVMLGKVLFVSPHEVLSDGRMDRFVRTNLSPGAISGSMN